VALRALAAAWRGDHQQLHAPIVPVTRAGRPRSPVSSLAADVVRAGSIAQANATKATRAFTAAPSSCELVREPEPEGRTAMLPLSDGVPARRFPVVTVLLIVANFAVWLLYELPNLNSAVYHASFYPCTIDNACHGPEPWGVSWITAMFMHGGWDHILGNMLFLAIFGKNVEDSLGKLRYLVFYFAGGFIAMMTQTAMTLLFGSPAEAHVPNLGASGAIAAVLGAYFVLYPRSQVTT